MAVLKKIKASTLMETLVATVLIVVVFMIASLVLNNLFASSIDRDTEKINYELARLQYAYEHGKLQLPYYSEKSGWSIEVTERSWQGQRNTRFIAAHLESKEELVQTIIHATKD